MYYVYIVECKDGTFYTGWTIDLRRRLEQHNRGKGAKYTRSRYPVVLKYYEIFSTKQEACRREYQIKQLPRNNKLSLIQDGLKSSALDIPLGDISK
ncbi:MAG TPA: GIY-YIG nuclease family protein [Peptococcaceae bacterium]|nr:GIY-YIG nuclease family protein [Peptococcaceae bacterium]